MASPKTSPKTSPKASPKAAGKKAKAAPKTAKKAKVPKAKGEKKPLTGFFKFSGEKRPEVMKSHPDWKITEVAAQLGKMWKALSDAEKAKFK